MLKNPFNSVHAVALINIGELASGLTVVSKLEKTNVKGIVVKLEAEYFKKAKGKITAVSQLDDKSFVMPTKQGEDITNKVVTDIFNSNNELVAKCYATWSLRVSNSQKKSE